MPQLDFFTWQSSQFYIILCFIFLIYVFMIFSSKIAQSLKLRHKLQMKYTIVCVVISIDEVLIQNIQ
jgi:flagellar biogenesis protein FliO